MILDKEKETNVRHCFELISLLRSQLQLWQDDRGETLAMRADISIAVSAALDQDNVLRYGYVISVLRGRRIRVF